MQIVQFSFDVNFQSLLPDTRYKLALDYLLDESLDISEIDYMLGYEDQTSFVKAFQMWEQVSPSKWRAQSLSRY
ncbi:AraC family transcriptional regulator [Alteromonadaceae bacterium M269]|nr:AraC family transcriptional regulator [Alteromonadaceae bacterium M269]